MAMMKSARGAKKMEDRDEGRGDLSRVLSARAGRSDWGEPRGLLDAALPSAWSPGYDSRPRAGATR